MYLPPFLRPVSKRYPRAFAAFMKWAKGRGMDEFIEEYPLEMIYGMLLIFFDPDSPICRYGLIYCGLKNILFFWM